MARQGKQPLKWRRRSASLQLLVLRTSVWDICDMRQHTLAGSGGLSAAVAVN